METRYNALAARFDGRDKLLQKDLKAYLEAFPYTTFADEVKFMQAVLMVEKGHYKQSLKQLEAINIQALSKAHQTDYSFYRGYAYLMMQEYQRASIYFAQLSKSENLYTMRATYYYAYCMYKLEKYDKALPALQRLEDEPAYSHTVPYFLTQAHYAMGNYEEAERRAGELLREYPEGENNSELHRILGEMYYLKADYTQAS
jgi:tetratricopeptide (TPR) repeat protein